jgi:hypothetical protein
MSIVQQLRLIVEALQQIQRALDLGAQLQWFIRREAGQVARTLLSFLFQTTDPAAPGEPFTQMEIVGHFLPLVQIVADAGLTVVVIWGFYKIMWVRPTFMSQIGARQLLPRICLGFVLINFAPSLVQAAIDANNVLCAGIETATGFTDVDFLLHDLPMEVVTPGLKGMVLVLLFAGYVVLAFSYVIRFALLVILTVLSPAVGLLLVVHDTQHLAHQWSGLFVAALLSQPLQLLVLALAAGLDAYGAWPIGHLFALAGLYICFKIPGALRSSSMMGGRAMTAAKRQGRKVVRLVAKAV